MIFPYEAELQNELGTPLRTGEFAVNHVTLIRDSQLETIAACTKFRLMPEDTRYTRAEIHKSKKRTKAFAVKRKRRATKRNQRHASRLKGS